MFNLESLNFTEMTQLGMRLRKMGNGAKSMEEVGSRIVRCFYDHLGSEPSQERQCVLVRLFKTHAYGQLDGTLRQSADEILGGVRAFPQMKCLVLVATAGNRPEWNLRLASSGHKAIPLPSDKAAERFPMISQLVLQLGIKVSDLFKTDSALMLDLAQHSFNVFHVPMVEGSPYVPAQAEFVLPYHVRSVIGFGGLLPTADMFAVIMFSRVCIGPEIAERFATLALSVKLALTPFSGRVFDSPAVPFVEGHAR